MKNNQTFSNESLDQKGACIQPMPVDRELQEILMQTHECRKRLQAYTNSIHDRALFQSIEDSALDAAECMANAITSISQFAANEMIFRLINKCE